MWRTKEFWKQPDSASTKRNSSKRGLRALVDIPLYFNRRKAVRNFSGKMCDFSWRWFWINLHLRKYAVFTEFLLCFILYFSVCIEKFIFFPLNTFSDNEKLLGMENEYFMRNHGWSHDRVKLFPWSSARWALMFSSKFCLLETNCGEVFKLSSSNLPWWILRKF